jgi:pimeloyl-ACP methyl ester carboxylesterase
VLVHGAWHGPWCWDRVTPLLKAADIDFYAVDLPSMNVNAGYVTTVHDDAADLRRTLDALEEPAVVVGHSYGGMVITEGAADHPNVRHLVYLAAFMPDVGESLNNLIARQPNPLLAGALRIDAERRSTLASESIGPAFYNDCDDATVAWASERLRPMLSESSESVRAAAWKTMPSTYVVCSEDKAIPPELQRWMAHRASHVVEWNTSHSPFASQPKLVADLIASIALSA